MDLDLRDKAALVTGASRGIGLATVKALTAEGARVVAAARTTSKELAATGATVVHADLSTLEGVHTAVDGAQDAVGDLDVLVNNVGGAVGDMAGGFADFDDEKWHAVWQLNFLTAVRVVRRALPGLQRTRGAIVNVSSIGARMPGHGPMPYTTAKAALTAFGTALAQEQGRHGVRVNTVSPGPTRTGLWIGESEAGARLAAARGVDQETLARQVLAELGFTTGRVIEPHEVASAIVYLASPLAGSVAGADYHVDGGINKAP